ncbi:MAG: AAA family ATPase [Thermoplasmata archaeon]|nr:AAA family ATPase [Thermoplasmata archaeon]
MALRVAVSGKGGVGKTTVAAILARLFGRDGMRVLAVDVDPSPSLASALGVPKDVRDKTTPISKMLDLIEERTGVKPGSSYGSLFTLNPKVDDLADKFGILTEDNVTLLVLGTIETGASGCFCPENALVRRLVGHLILKRDEALVLDMEAGVEHLGRGTAESVDVLIIVIEPGTRSVETARNIRRLAGDIGLKKIVAVLNKSRGEKDEEFAREKLKELDIDLLASVPFSDCVVSADLDDVSPMDSKDCKPIVDALLPMKDSLSELGP